MKKFDVICSEFENEIFDKIHKKIQSIYELKCKINYINYTNYDVFKKLIENLKNNISNGICIEKYLDYNIKDFIDKKSERANILSEVNVITLNENKILGNNTKYTSLLDLFLINDINLTKKNILIIGTSKISQILQILFKDFKANSIFVLSNKEINKAIPKIVFINKLELKKLKNIDIIINTTSIGENEFFNDVPLNLNENLISKYVVDLVKVPFNTVFLMQAKKLGAKKITSHIYIIAKILKTYAIWYNDVKMYNPNIIYKIYEELFIGE